MTLHLAQHFGMCFGVRNALRTTFDAARQEPVTMLGQLVHNPLVDAHLQTLGVRRGDLNQEDPASTTRVIISAHGASRNQKNQWLAKGHQVTDTSCPLVQKAHQALALLVEEGYHPVVIGQRQHVEVRGLVGDWPHASVLLAPEEVAEIPPHAPFSGLQTVLPGLTGKVRRDIRHPDHDFPHPPHPGLHRAGGVLWGKCDLRFGQ